MKIIERIQAFDVVRGFAVIFMVILHTGLHEWLGAQELEGGEQQADPVMGFLIFFLTIAGVYSTILVAVNSYMFYRRIESGKNTPTQLTYYGLFLGIFLIALNFVFRIFLSGDSGWLYFLVKNGNPTFSEPFWLVSSSALTILGLNSILVPLIMRILNSRLTSGLKNRQVYVILFWMGSLILLLTLPFRWMGAPVVDSLIDSHRYVLAWILGCFVYDNFPLFPFVAYACFGAILGIALARKEKPKYILEYTWFQTIFWFGVGFLGMYSLGGIHPGLIYETSRIALLEDFFRHITQLGVVFLFFSLALSIVDFAPHDRKIRRIKGFRFITRYGMISLTVYIFEAFFSGLITGLLNLIPAFHNWNASLMWVIVLGVVLAGLWGVAAKFWEKVGYKYSVEWWLIWIAGKFSGKKSEKYQMERISQQDSSKLAEPEKIS
ncbi:MAG: hypothetical protein K9W44_07865 [Candidatus Lokiarchaeota archaeon]|nr:hypothetical protein [Candidatus Harpocratesius repetitus]